MVLVSSHSNATVYTSAVIVNVLSVVVVSLLIGDLGYEMICKKTKRIILDILGRNRIAEPTGL